MNPRIKKIIAREGIDYRKVMKLSKVVLIFTIVIIGIMGLIGITVVLAEDGYESTIQSPTPFMGNDGEVFKLLDGSVWEVKYEYEYMYEYYPRVVAFPSKGKILVNGKMLNVMQLSGPRIAKAGTNSRPNESVIESVIVSDFDGLGHGKIYELGNGQVWQQTDYWIWIWVWVRPNVMIYCDGGFYKMKVENIDHAVTVERIK